VFFEIFGSEIRAVTGVFSFRAASATKGKRGKQPTLSPEVALPPPEVFEVEALEEQYASDYMLKMEPGPPIYPYLNSTYHIVVHLVDRQNHLVIGHNVPLHVELLFESGEPVPNPTEVLTMHPADPVIAGTGQIRIAMTFMQLSLQQGGRSFLVRVSAAENSVTPPLGEIESKTSLPLKVVYAFMIPHFDVFSVISIHACCLCVPQQIPTGCHLATGPGLVQG
jgi:hypothetical protein